MLKFIKQNLETITGIEIYPIISLLIFFLFFVLLIWWVATYKKEKVDHLGSLPLDDN